MKKRVVILGSAGSIGENALRVAERLEDRLTVVGLAVQRNVERVLEQAVRFGVRTVAVSDCAAAAECREKAPAGVKVLAGPGGLVELAAETEADVVLCAVVGIAGLPPVLAALERGRTVALATKEVLVAAGSLVMAVCARTGARLIPVDSEHSAIFQCLDGRPTSTVARILLTASGGPFAGRPEVDLDRVTVSEALKHPRWRMGRKVSVDSATLMNKGLEIMEAQWLFGLPLDRIHVLIHPESVVHSMVEFTDGGVLAQLSPPDMRFAIQYALTWPERVDGGLPRLKLEELGRLHFRAPEEERFPALRLARQAAADGGTMPAVLNAANEAAVQGFLEGRMAFSGIWKTVAAVMQRHCATGRLTLDEIWAADRWAREEANRLVGAGRAAASVKKAGKE